MASEKPQGAAPPPTDLLILDFEATCDGASDDQISRLAQCEIHELIEFPVVHLSGDSLEELAVFHEYVRPAAGRQLTPFCVQLTGITQETVDQASELRDVLGRFVQWVEARGLDRALLADPCVPTD